MGVDGFYHSTQGGESGRFSDPTLFAACVKPYDLVLMEEINRRCIFNILHICDYNGGYDDLTPFLDYPGDVVSCPLLLGDRRLELQDVAHLFNRPVMGGLDRHGVLVDGNSTAIQEIVQQTLQTAPNRFILGADCTVPNASWDNLKAAIDTAHGWK